MLGIRAIEASTLVALSETRELIVVVVVAAAGTSAIVDKDCASRGGDDRGADLATFETLDAVLASKRGETI